MRGAPLLPLYRVLNRLSLQRKVFLSYVVLILVPMAVLTWFSYHRSADVMRRQTMQSADQVFGEAVRQLDSLADKAVGALNTVTLDGQVNAILSTNVEQYEIPAQLTDYYKLTPFLNNIEKSQGVYQVMLYIDDRFVYSNDGARLYPLSSLDLKPWYVKLKNAGLSAYWFVPEEGEQRVPVVSVARTIWNIQDFTQQIGVARVDIPLADLERIVSDARITASSEVKLLNDAGDGDASLFAVSGPEGGDGEASSVLTRIAAVPRTSWTLESRVSLKEALQPLSALRNRMLITMIVVTAIAYVFAYFYSDLSTKRIKRLSERMRRVQSGDLQVVMTESGKDEIGELVGSFNYMVRRMNGLVQEQFQMGQALKNAELRTLQAQINPHLLYNSLDTINCLAIAHQVPDISRMVRALTQFYKLGLSKGHELVPLRAELQHIRAYIGIMNMRYEHAIELRIEAEPELEACLVLRTMLQPIVENAVYHGILETERKRGTIVVAAALETDRTLCVIVRDDGRGMTADQAARLFERPSDDSREGGFGLLNVNDRIRLTFGEAYGLSAESRPDSGTVIRLRLPGDLSRPA